MSESFTKGASALCLCAGLDLCGKDTLDKKEIFYFLQQGTIYVRHALDREMADEYTLRVMATDNMKGAKEERLQATAQVNVHKSLYADGMNLYKQHSITQLVTIAASVFQDRDNIVANNFLHDAA